MAVIAGIVGKEAEAVKRSGADDGRSWTWRSRAHGGAYAFANEPRGRPPGASCFLDAAAGAARVGRNETTRRGSFSQPRRVVQEQRKVAPGAIYLAKQFEGREISGRQQ